VNQVIKDADVLLLILDARLVEETRNKEVEDKVQGSNKPLIYVMTKCDLVDKEDLTRYRSTLKPSVFISSTKHLGTTKLRDRILIETQRAGIEKRRIKVGVLGYPNVGKSSLINAMTGRKAAPTSILSGYTKGVQKVRADNRIMFLDTPGVIPYKEKDFVKHAMIGTIDFARIKEPDIAVMEMMIQFPGRVEEFYGVEIKEDIDETLEEITIKKNILKKGAQPDTLRMARIILKDWQKGVIGELKSITGAKTKSANTF